MNIFIIHNSVLFGLPRITTKQTEGIAYLSLCRSELLLPNLPPVKELIALQFMGENAVMHLTTQ